MFRESENDEESDDNLSAMLDDLSNRKTLFRFLWTCVALNVALWLCVTIFYKFANDTFRQIFDIYDKAGGLVLLIPFLLGISITYSLCRLKFPDVEEVKLQAEMMSSYNYQTRSMKRWYIWLLSILGGVLNLALLVLVNLYLNDQL